MAMICGEVELKVVHNLIAKPDTSLSEIEVVLSHPQALAQCRKFLKSTLPRVELREVSSTAKAVEMLIGLDNAAAIGSEAAAERSGMAVLRRGIEDEPNNVTRFFVISESDAERMGRDKTSLVFSAKHVPGSLYRVLEVFAVRNINLTRIESRPEKRKPWNYVFYLDFEGHRTDASVKEALDVMGKRCIYVKLLGSYPKAT
jgi:prephenate dehydratase